MEQRVLNQSNQNASMQSASFAPSLNDFITQKLDSLYRPKNLAYTFITPFLSAQPDTLLKQNVNYIHYLKSTSEYVLLLTVKVQLANNQSEYQSFLVFANLHKPPTQQFRFFQLMLPIEQAYNYYCGFQYSSDLGYAPQNLQINQIENLIVIYTCASVGANKILVGELPTSYEAREGEIVMHELRVDESKNNKIQQRRDQSAQMSAGITQIEFSVLNQSCLIVMTRSNQVHIYNLLKSLEVPEQTFDLNEQLPELLENGVKKSEVNFVSFSQGGSTAKQLGLVAFQLLLMTNFGQVYQLCPFFPLHIMLNEDQFSMLHDYLEKKIDYYELQIDQLQNINIQIEFSDIQAIIETKEMHIIFRKIVEKSLQPSTTQNIKSLVFDPNDFVRQVQRNLVQIKPVLQGPFIVKNLKNEMGVIYKSIHVCYDLPFSFMRVSSHGVDLVVTYSQPDIQFTNFDTGLSNLSDKRFTRVSGIQFEDDLPFYVQMNRDLMDDLVYYLQIDSSLYKLDLINLMRLQENFIQNREVTKDDVSDKIKFTPLVDSFDDNNLGQYQVFGMHKLFMGFNPKNPKTLDLTLLSSAQAADQDEINKSITLSLQQQFEQMNLTRQQNITQLKGIPWRPSITIPEFKLDPAQLKGEEGLVYAITALQSFSEILLREYPTQYEGIDKLISAKLNQLDDIRIQMVQQAIETQNFMIKLEEVRVNLEKDMHKVKQQGVRQQNVMFKFQDVIAEKMDKIKEKIKKIKDLGNTDFLIQIYVEKLEHNAKRAKESISICKERLKNMNEIDGLLRREFKNYKGPFDEKEIRQFLIQNQLKLEKYQEQYKSFVGQQ